ncbi:MAG: VOC family protein [Deltaproteobacteria bacterium]|nr:MAG: VOC family protein [Deltaproteobacteria bacterium]
MITGLRDVYVNVADMDRAVAFYVGVLGLTLVEHSEWWSTLDCGGMRFGLHGTGGSAVPPLPHDDHGPHAGAVLTFQTDDAHAEAARLQKAGATLLSAVVPQPWGTLFTFADPDGNVHKCMQPPE